ncbi:nitroreductase family protein [Macrococcus hajekii]|uniref:Nitroreductase family protein n=1 Tax=Macrococcus hajekii TaxID=198482 RepID=A0A4R6BI81_9STAP|nr:nitroreductase family protein [Macrococcus hajekii]TDM01255.1 nitroreductase family protein [Macrococcus hajekii]GGB11277.1 NADH oxidase [Macrococcus hajekii]
MSLTLIEAIKARKSVKEFDAAVKIPQSEMMEMLELATEAPSSVNLQPWRFVVVESDEAKEAIKDLVRFNTRQLETSSAFILVLSDHTHIHDIEKVYGKSVELGYMPEEVMTTNVAALKGALMNAPDSYIQMQGMMDANLAAMQFMLIAKDYGYDTNPIGGFERDEVMDALSINKERYVPVMFIAIGKGIKEPYDSSRHEIEEIVAYNYGDADGNIGK